MEIKQNLTTVNRTIRNNKGRVKYIVIHFTSNNGDSAYANTKYFKDADRKASAHYFADEREVCQCVRDGDDAWHCGTKGTYYHPVCRNANSIGIEMCSRKDANGVYYIMDETITNTVALTKQLMQSYSVPVENILRHYDVTHKSCPEPFVREPELWEDFKNRLNESEEINMEELKILQDKVGYIDESLTALHASVSKLVDQTSKRYNSVAELPEYARGTVQKLVDKGTLKGGEGGALGLSEDMVRMMVVLDRAGVLV